jgi:hypothetical protein
MPLLNCLPMKRYQLSKNRLLSVLQRLDHPDQNAVQEVRESMKQCWWRHRFLQGILNKIEMVALSTHQRYFLVNLTLLAFRMKIFY